MMFDDRKPKSVATETTIPAGYRPPESANILSPCAEARYGVVCCQICDVCLATVQSSSDVGRDRLAETADHNEKVSGQSNLAVWSRDYHMFCRFSRDDMLKMDFDAYLASSGGESDSDSGTPGEGGEVLKVDHSGAKHNKVKKYRSLLVEGGGGCEGGDKTEGGRSEEVMEISWEPGLREGVEEMVQRKRGKGEGEGEGGTTWDRYLQERNKRARQKRAEVK